MSATGDKLPFGTCVLNRGKRVGLTQQDCEEEGGRFVIDPVFAKFAGNPWNPNAMFHPGGMNPVGMTPPKFSGGAHRTGFQDV